MKWVLGLLALVAGLYLIFHIFLIPVFSKTESVRTRLKTNEAQMATSSSLVILISSDSSSCSWGGFGSDEGACAGAVRSTASGGSAAVILYGGVCPWGYYPSGGSCTAIPLPPHGIITGNTPDSWGCDYGYKKSYQERLCAPS